MNDILNKLKKADSTYFSWDSKQDPSLQVTQWQKPIEYKSFKLKLAFNPLGPF